VIKRQKGFTLIELLVVIAIIGLLATIVMVSLNTARQKARDARRISDIRQLQVALQLYYDSYGHYPSDFADLMSVYISAGPLDPVGANYQYCITANGASYHLGTSGTGLETLSNPALDIDADDESDGCTDGHSFSGEDPVYDVKP